MNLFKSKEQNDLDEESRNFAIENGLDVNSWVKDRRMLTEALKIVDGLATKLLAAKSNNASVESAGVVLSAVVSILVCPDPKYTEDLVEATIEILTEVVEETGTPVEQFEAIVALKKGEY